MREDKTKYLEFILNVVNRLATNSFLIKGWVVSIIVALLAFEKSDSEQEYIGIAYLAVPIFWFMNGYYLSQERKFRDLYKKVRGLSAKDIDYDMDISTFANGKNSILAAMFSISVCPIYSALLVILYILQK